MEKIVYNPITDRFPSGTLKTNQFVNFNLKIRCDLFVNKVTLVLRHEKSGETKYLDCKLVDYDVNYFIYGVKINLDISGLYWYHFKVEASNQTFYVNKSNDYVSALDVQEEFPLTVIKNEIKSNKDFMGGIIYHIFVDRFNSVGKINVREGFVYRDDWGGKITKNTEDRVELNYEVFGGNLQGIIAKLDYLRDFGVTTIYLSPIFMAPSNHKYDTSDYSNIDSMFGDQRILMELIVEAEARNIGIILDGVFNHIGSDSIYFNKENKFDVLGAYNSKESEYYDWFRFNTWPDDYDCWWGIKTLPSVNQSNPHLQEYMSSIIKKYMAMGLQGFRLDVVDEIHHELLTKICSSIYSVKKDALIIGEVWEDASTKVSYGNRRGYFLGEELNSVMNYPLKNALLEYVLNKNCDDFHYVYQMIEDNYPEYVKHNLMNLVGSHDTKRILSILKNKDNYLSLLKVVTGLQFTFYGVPSIFYGDEAGIEDDEPDFSRKCYPWGNENKDILNWYKKLTRVRRYKVFKEGKMNLLKCENGIIVYNRIFKNEEILVISNMCDDKFEYDDGCNYKSLLDDKNKNQIVVEGCSIDILIKQKK